MNEHFDSGSREERPPGLGYAQAMEQLVEAVQLLSLARDLPTVMDIVRHAARKLTGADGATAACGRAQFLEERHGLVQQ